MAVKIKGKCKYCGKEYTKGYILKHLGDCKNRKEKMAAEKGTKKCGYFSLMIQGKYDNTYWLVVEMREDATLQDLDNFLRDIWLECCGHLSAFTIDGIDYESTPAESSMWGEPAESMKHKLKTVLQKGMVIEYEYDFGSTTSLIIEVKNYFQAVRKKEKLVILSRNNPPEILCSYCGKKPAVYICAECMYDDTGFLCDDCSKTHECGEDMLLSVCNSPRMGVCAYDGSNTYPDQFMADIE